MLSYSGTSLTMLQHFEWKPKENNGMNQCIDTSTPKHLKNTERERENRVENESVKVNAKAHMCPHTHKNIQKQKSLTVAHNFHCVLAIKKCPPSVPFKNERLPYSGPMNLIRRCHGNIPGLLCPSYLPTGAQTNRRHHLALPKRAAMP